MAATLALTAVSATDGVSLGVACAWARLHGAGWLKAIVGAYVEPIRNTPFIVQLFFLFFGLPGIGIKLSPEVASVLAMVVNLGGWPTPSRSCAPASPRRRRARSRRRKVWRFPSCRCSRASCCRLH